MTNKVREKENTHIQSGPEVSGPLEAADPAETTDDRSNSVRGRQAVWMAWWAGTILIVLSWFGVVSNVIGWIGFAAALAASFVSVMINKYWRMPR